MIAAPSERLYRAAFAVVFVTGAFVLGFGVRAIVEPAPPACHDMADSAKEMARILDATVVAATARGDALDPTTYRVHDAEVRHLLASLEAVAPQYDTAEADCLGES